MTDGDDRIADERSTDLLRPVVDEYVGRLGRGDDRLAFDIFLEKAMLVAARDSQAELVARMATVDVPCPHCGKTAKINVPLQEYELVADTWAER